MRRSGLTKEIDADASPEKRLFISLLTRDIPLIAAFLDLVDNSVNAAIEPFADRLATAQDYATLFNDESITPEVEIKIVISKEGVQVSDDAGGISAKTAADHVFKFGRGSEDVSSTDRLSVYGIGLKRAMFKLGNIVNIRSDHTEGGFDMTLNVSKWEREDIVPWKFKITPRSPTSSDKCGTCISVSELYDSTIRRLSDGVFEGQLRDEIARTYSYYLKKLVNVSLNGKPIDGVGIDIGSNYSTERFSEDGVTCMVTAGIGVPRGDAYRDRSAGWFIFCNGRAVISADKSFLTGWGSGTGLPIFQPKHRPFIGTVFFVSNNPEQLPWTTTKSGINEDSTIWQAAKRHMITTARTVITFLDGRYTDTGTDIASKELQESSGGRTISALAASTSPAKAFEAPQKPKPVTIRVQFDAKVSHVKAVGKHLGKSSITASEAGRYTFEYFVRNELGEE